MLHTYDTLERILDHCVICSIKETDPDISTLYFSCNTWKSRYSWMAETLFVESGIEYPALRSLTIAYSIEGRAKRSRFLAIII